MAETNTEATPVGGYTPPAGSLEAASLALGKVFSAQADTEPKPETQPEPPTSTAKPDQQASAATEPESSGDDPEQTKPESDEASDTPDDQPDTTPVYKVRVDGKEVPVTIEEALKGYSRTQDYTLKTQKLAEERKAFDAQRESEIQAVRAQRDQYATVLPELQKVLEVMTTEPDWSKRALEVPQIQLAEEIRAWKDQRDGLTKVHAEAQRVQQERNAEAEARFTKGLLSAFPELSEPEKASKTVSAWREGAREYGFSEEEFAGTRDHRVFQLLHDAMQYRKQQANKPVIANKIEQAIKPSAPGNRGPAKPKSALAEATQRLRQSGSVEDGAAALGAFINAR